MGCGGGSIINVGSAEHYTIGEGEHVRVEVAIDGDAEGTVNRFGYCGWSERSSICPPPATHRAMRTSSLLLAAIVVPTGVISALCRAHHLSHCAGGGFHYRTALFNRTHAHSAPFPLSFSTPPPAIIAHDPTLTP